MKRLPRTVIAYLVSLVVMALVGLIRHQTLPPQIPLFYSLPESESQIVDMWNILLIPILSFVFINVNNLIARKWFQKDYFIRRTLYVANLLIILFFTYIFVKILFLVS